MSALHQHAIAAALALAAAGAPASGGEEQCEEDPIADLVADLEPPACRPGEAPPKADKVWGGSGTRYRPLGRREIATTLFNVHTREALPIFEKRLPPAAALARFFRCRGFGSARDLDPRLLEAALAAAAEFEAPRVEIISAYRSPKMNETLGKKGRRVAAESRHTQGQALDFRVTTVPARRVGEWLWESFEGGVGIYDRDDFVHVDVGPKRRWEGR